MLVEIEPLLELLTMEQKAAQMLMVSYPFTTLTSDWERFFRVVPVGGVRLDERNFQSPAQLRSLLEQLQDFAQESNHGIPLLLAVAQEGGDYAPLHFARALHPGSLALGATRNSELAYEAARMCANELRSYGFTFNLGPSADVLTSYASALGVRCFGEREDLVSQMLVKSVKGLQENGVGACVGHFPGLGSATVDSYQHLASIALSEEQLLAQDIKPFVQALSVRADALMMSLALYPGLDREGYPASLSPKITTDVLRTLLGFKGMIVSAPLDARTVLERIPEEEAASLAVRAGSDMLQSRGGLEDAVKMFTGILSGVERRYYEVDRVQEAVTRVLRQKVRRGSTAVPLRDQPEPLMQKIARASVTLVRNHDGLLPLKVGPEEWIGVLSPHPQYSSGVTMGDTLQVKHPWVEEVRYDSGLALPAAELAQRFANCKVLFLVTRSAGLLSEEQVQMFQGVMGLGKPVVLVATQNPYHLMHFPFLSTCLVTYTSNHYAMEALADVVLGEVSPQGRLPVSLPQVAEYGTGVSYGV